MKKFITTGILLLLGVVGVMGKGVPMDLKLERTDRDEPVTFKELAKGQKAILMDFWATWCGPCMRLMPHLKETGASLEEYGIKVVGMSLDNKVKAEAVRIGQGMDSLDWLVDTQEKFYQNHFKVNRIPQMVLMDAEGNVLFQGHPEDDGLKLALAKLKAGKSS